LPKDFVSVDLLTQRISSGVVSGVTAVAASGNRRRICARSLLLRQFIAAGQNQRRALTIPGVLTGTLHN
jgi:hypothetical protein